MTSAAGCSVAWGTFGSRRAVTTPFVTDPVQVDSDRRCRELETEVDRLKRLVAELMLDKQMLQDLAKKKW